MKKCPKSSSTFYCEICNYNTCKKNHFQRHFLSAKHQFRTETAQKVPEWAKPFSCERCNYSTDKSSLFQRHLFTNKHTRLSNTFHHSDNLFPFKCMCGKSYTARNSLWYHKQKCQTLLHTTNQSNNNDDNNHMQIDSLTNTILALVEQNSKLQQTQLEFQTTINEIIPKIGPQTSTTNNHTNCNNTFNVQVFLNNHCNNAISIQDFVQSIELNMDHMIAISNDGYVDSISNVLIQALNKLELTDRPLHCTDLKRDTIYIKDENQWNKSTSDAPIMNRVITKIEDKHYRLVGEYVRNHPQTRVLDSPEYNLYTKAGINSLGNGEDHSKLNKKIYKKILPNVKLDKHATNTYTS